MKERVRMVFKAKQKDYDLVRRISEEYYEKLNSKKEIIIEQSEKSRIGFYYLVLSLTLGISELSELSEMIIDTSFQKKMNNVNNGDCGIDAVYIDREDKKVKLFSFKYRESFKNGDTRSPSELNTTRPFLGYLKKEIKELDTIVGSDITKNMLKDISELNSKEEIDFELYMVSNDCGDFVRDDAAVEEFKDNYSWLQIKTIGLEDIAQQVTLHSEPNNAVLYLQPNDILQHEMDYITASSYVAKIKLTDLIKITSIDHSIRSKKSIDDAEIIESQTIDLNVLFDNVRGYLGNTKYNTNIINTLSTEPEKFFLFNNGLTITADDISVQTISMGTFYKIELTNYQIVNGGQTLRTIYSFKDSEKDKVNNLAKASVLIRLFKTGMEDGLVNKVAEFTNSQNQISGRDLKAVDKLQIDIESRFKVEKIKYIRKMNKVDDVKDDTPTISMEKLGQLLLSDGGYPERASNSKKKIFNEYYNYIFNDSKDFMDNAIFLTKLYHKILDAYKTFGINYKYYEQKSFYIVYIVVSFDKSEKKQIENYIKLLEDFLVEYRKGEDIPESRKLIQKGFKEKIDKYIRESRETNVKIKAPIKLR